MTVFHRESEEEQTLLHVHHLVESHHTKTVIIVEKPENLKGICERVRKLCNVTKLVRVKIKITKDEILPL